MDRSERLPARYLALLVAYLGEQGVECLPLLQEAGIDSRQLQRSDAWVHRDHLVAALRMLVTRAGRQDLGLMIGGLVTLGHLGEVGRAMLACKNMGEALRCCERYQALITLSLRLQMRVDERHCELLWRPARPLTYELTRLSLDIPLAALHAYLHQSMRERAPVFDAYLEGCSPASLALYSNLSLARCHVDPTAHPALRLILPTTVLSEPMPLASAQEFAELEVSLQARLRALLPHQDWKALVTSMLKFTDHHQPGLNEMAAWLGVSSSVLVRNLSAQGCSYRQVLNAVWHERACQWLDDGVLPMKDIADRLGYANPANFVRAFRTHSGMTPTAYANRTREHVKHSSKRSD